MNAQEILNSIDLNKINLQEKKKRGRPKKTSHQLSTIPKIKTSSNIEEEIEDEIILHLPLLKSDIATLKLSKYNIEDDEEQLDNENTNSDDEKSVKSNSDNEYISNDIHLKQFGLAYRKLKTDYDELKKFLTEITPMYFTEVKVYPIDLKLFDKQNNELIPKKTNIHCWWCTYQFDTFPTYLPEKYFKDEFYVCGCFCSFNCAGAYNLSLNDNKIWERYSLLKQLYYIINKDKISSMVDIEINIAGPKELLEKYGGTMKIDDYRKNSKILGREYHKLIPPFVPLTFAFEETTNSKISGKNVNINNILNLHRNDNIIIKRNKPLNNIASQHIDKYIE
jgi:hypothetical protein